jgi:hypothetical protein
MSVVFDRHDPAALGARLGTANEVTPELMNEVIDTACFRLSSLGQSKMTERLTRFIDSGAWMDAALMLIELELPFWHIRRIAYDDGEWYCALSKERELPDWISDSVEARHADLALALLSALAEAQVTIPSPANAGSALATSMLDPLYAPVCCDNFR